MADAPGTGTEESLGRRFKERGLLLILLPYPIVIIAFFETLRLPWDQFLAHFSLFPLSIQVWGDYFQTINGFYIDVVAIQVAVFIVALLVCKNRLLLGAVMAAGAGSSSYVIYRLLVTYPPFEGYIPFVLGLVLFAVGIGACGYIAFSVQFESRFGRRLRLVIGCGGLMAGGLMLWAHHTFFPGQYPSLHLSLIGLSLVAMWWALYAVGTALDKSLLRQRKVVLGLLISTVGVIGVAMVADKSDIPSIIEPYLVSISEVKYQTVNYAEVTWSESRAEFECVTDGTDLSKQEAIDVFFEHSGFPQLDQEIPLDELNVLLIMVEATRFDDTNLDPEQPLDITPMLRDFSERGAFNFVNAHAPSSNTISSTSAVMSMSNPSLAPVTIQGHRSSRGELRDESFTGFTVAQYFQEMGHETFRFVHHASGMPDRRGLDRGFAEGRVVAADRDDREHAGVDERITDKGLQFIENRARDDDPFFGWLFYWSPHDPYVQRDSKGDSSSRGRYRQEIRHTDEQIRRVLEYLDAEGLMDETIVVIASDHGEEFGEHGGTKHSRTLYREVVHIPLLVSIPSVDGWAVEEPASLSNVFTWLMLHATSLPMEHMLDHIQGTVSPSILAAEGAVVSELLAADGGQVSLLDNDHKIIHRIGSGRTEVFDVNDDPWEQDDLYLSGSEVVEDKVKHLNRYLEFRACNEEFKLGWE